MSISISYNKINPFAKSYTNEQLSVLAAAQHNDIEAVTDQLKTSPSLIETARLKDTGDTVIHIAVEQANLGNRSLLEALKSFGARFSTAKNNEGVTPYQIALPEIKETLF